MYYYNSSFFSKNFLTRFCDILQCLHIKSYDFSIHNFNIDIFEHSQTSVSTQSLHHARTISVKFPWKLQGSPRTQEFWLFLFFPASFETFPISADKPNYRWYIVQSIGCREKYSIFSQDYSSRSR